MKRSTAMISIILAAMINGLIMVSTANADIHGSHYGHSGRYYNPSYRPRRHYRGHDYHRHSHRHYGHGAYGNYNGRPSYHDQNQSYPCRPVYKSSYDEYGIPRQFTGTLCYDNYGQGYIVEGSRYEIR